MHKIAGEGFAYAQTAFKQAGGERKLQEALQYASLTLSSQGIIVSQVELRSAIEKAYLNISLRQRQCWLPKRNRAKKQRRPQLRRLYLR
ncbi:phage holin, LLH family [Paenibacillus sp. S33]